MILISFCACNSSSNQPNSCALNIQNLVGSYKIVSEKIQVDSLSAGYENIGNWDDCESDNIYQLEADSTFILDHGVLPCINSILTETGQWSLNTDTLKLYYSPNFIESIIISNFNCSSFQSINKDPLTGEIRTITYEKQP